MVFRNYAEINIFMISNQFLKEGSKIN